MQSRKITPQQALTRCEALCARSEQSSGDIAMKLKKWGLSQADVAAILRQLEGDGYVDDARYARAYVREKFRFAGWGRVKIAYGLRQKSVDNNAIAEAMDEIDADEYVAKLEALLGSKSRTMKSREPMQMRASLLRFAAQRGFESGVSVAAVNKVMGNSSNVFDD